MFEFIRFLSSKRARSWVRYLTLVAVSLAASAREAAAHGRDGEPLIEAGWVELPARDSVTRGADPSLTARLRNLQPYPLGAELVLSVTADGKHREYRYPDVALPAGETREVSLRLPLAGAVAEHLMFSGRFKLHVSIRPPWSEEPGAHSHGGDQSTLPAVWFHPEGQRVVLYREDALRERFSAGNFRALPLAAPDPRTGLRVALDEAGLVWMEPVLSNVGALSVSPGGDGGGQLPPGARKFCLVMDGGAFNDSSDDSFDYGEDVGRAGSNLPLARGWVVVGQYGAPLFTGFLDAEGCTSYVQANADAPVSIAFSPIYLHPSSGVKGFVSDLNLGPQWPDSMPFYLFFFDPVDQPINLVSMDMNEYVLTIFTAAATCLERASGGLEDVLYEFRLGLGGNNAGTSTAYAAEGHPRVHIKYSDAARAKFTVAHEYAHAMGISTLVPQITPADIDYSADAGDPEWQHTIESEEWNLVAAFEGFANFVAATVWNDVFTDADAVFVDGASPVAWVNTAYDLDQFSNVFLAEYGSEGNEGQGVELDWAQFFWAWHTNSYPGSVPASLPLMVGIWNHAYAWPADQAESWPVQEGFYADFSGAAFTLLNVYIPIIPHPVKVAQMETWRVAAGIVP